MRLLTFVATFAASLFVGQAAFSQDARQVRLAHVAPPGTAWDNAANALAKDVTDKFGGRFKMTVFPSAQLGNEARMLQQVQTGALDMAFLTVAEPLNKINDLGVLYAPFLVDSVEEAEKVLNGKVAKGLLDRFPKELGVISLGYAMGGRRVILTNFEFNGIDDMQGRKLRITPVLPADDFYRLLGATPTPIPLPNLFDALANRQVDGVDMELEVIAAVRLQDHASHLYVTYHQLNPMVAVVSRNFWGSLTDEERQSFNELVDKSLAKIFALQFASEKRIVGELQKDKIKVIVSGPERFGGALEKWDNIWSKKSSLLSDIRAEVNRIRSK